MVEDGRPRTPKYDRRFHEVIGSFPFRENVFRNQKIEILHQANRLMAEYEMDPKFLHNPIRTLMTLAISDELLATQNIAERAKLHDVFKLLATDGKSTTDKTYSRKVHAEAEAGDVRSRYFDPEWSNRIKWYEEQAWTDEEYITAFTSPEPTTIANALATDWGEDSILHDIRTALGITPQMEKPFEIFVVNKTTAEIDGEMGGGARCTVEYSHPSKIILPSDHESFPNFYPHEYGHSQSQMGLMMGHQGLLFRALNEAETDIATQIPASYPYERDLRERIVSAIPDLKENLALAYMGDMERYFHVLASITNKYGAEAIVALARLEPEKNPHFTNPIEKSVYLQPEEVGIFFMG